MATKTTTKDGEIYADVPVRDDDTKNEELEVVCDKVMTSQVDDAAQVDEMERGTPKRKMSSKAPLEPMDVSQTSTSNNNEAQETSDFVACCLAQSFCGFVGSGLVFCANCNRPNYPTPAAWNGFRVGVVVALYLLLYRLGNTSGNY